MVEALELERLELVVPPVRTEVVVHHDGVTALVQPLLFEHEHRTAA